MQPKVYEAIHNLDCQLKHLKEWGVAMTYDHGGWFTTLSASVHSTSRPFTIRFWLDVWRDTSTERQFLARDVSDHQQPPDYTFNDYRAGKMPDCYRDVYNHLEKGRKAIQAGGPLIASLGLP